MLRLISEANIPVSDLNIITEDEGISESSSEEQDLLKKKISGNQLNRERVKIRFLSVCRGSPLRTK